MVDEAIFLRRYGGPDAFTVEAHDPGAPATGEVQVRHTAVGINDIDVFRRMRLARVPLPTALVLAAAGEVTAISGRIARFKCRLAGLPLAGDAKEEARGRLR